MLVRIGIMARNLGVSTSTLRRWEKKGKYISTLRTLGGHRRYETSTRSNTPKTVALYARVSAHKQTDDLRRQLNTLENYALENDYLIVKKCFDIASGLNDRRQGLLRLLRLCASGAVDRVLIIYDDRLARFGTHTLKELLSHIGVRVKRVFPSADKDYTLAEDIIALVTSYAGRLHRSRRGKSLTKPPPQS